MTPPPHPRSKNDEMTMIPPTATTGAKACCWICLEEGTDDHGQPLTRNCACRGDSGWAHVACLARFAKVKTDGMSVDEYTEMIASCKGTAWSVCHTCKQKYHGDVKTSLAKEWMDSVAGLDDVSPQRIAAIFNFGSTSFQNDAFDAAIQVGDDLRGILHSNKLDIDPKLWAHAENNCLIMLTSAYSRVGNKEKGREYAEKYKSFNKSMRLSHPDYVDSTVKIMLEGLTTGDDRVRIATDIYNSAVQTNGKDSPAAINLAASVAYAMLKDQKFEDSYHWLKDAHDRARRVLGEDNPEYTNTKQKYLIMSAHYEPRRGTLVLNNSKLNGKEVTILRATKDGKKYIVEIGSETGLAEKVKVTPSQLIFTADTPVTAKDLDEDCTLYIDSFDKETSSYKVFVMYGVKDGDEYAYLYVPRKDVAVIFPSRVSKLEI